MLTGWLLKITLNCFWMLLSFNAPSKPTWMSLSNQGAAYCLSQSWWAYSCACQDPSLACCSAVLCISVTFSYSRVSTVEVFCVGTLLPLKNLLQQLHLLIFQRYNLYYTHWIHQLMPPCNEFSIAVALLKSSIFISYLCNQNSYSFDSSRLIIFSELYVFFYLSPHLNSASSRNLKGYLSALWTLSTYWISW